VAALEWINPRYVGLMAALRQRQETGPRARCLQCRSTGETTLPASHGGSAVVCPRCTGRGSVPAVRMFVTG
jgi:hypothetical protein